MPLVPRHTLKTFSSPVITSGGVDANIVRTNDNITATMFNAHDADAAIHVQSGTLAARPTTAVDGATYFCTDTRDTYSRVAGAWVQSAWAHWYCAFSDYTDQTTAAANTATKVTFNTTDVVNGFSLVSSSRMTAAYAGVYNFQWSGQFTNTDASEQDVDIWIRINNTDVTGSTGRVSIPKKHGSIDGHALPAWNYYLTLNANDYVELYWAASSTTVRLETTAASAWAPSTASIIATMTRV